MRETLCVRWTAFDARASTIEALRLSIWGAFRCFGAAARYDVGVDALVAPRLRATLGALPVAATVRALDRGALPRWLARADVSPRVLLRLLPILLAPDRPDVAELALDPHCVLFATPPSIASWLADRDPRACVVLEERAGPSAAIRGVGRGFDLEEGLREVLRARPRPLRSEHAVEELELEVLELLAPAHRVLPGEVCEPDGRCGVRLAPPSDGLAVQPYLRRCAELAARLGAPVTHVGNVAPRPPLAS